MEVTVIQKLQDIPKGELYPKIFAESNWATVLKQSIGLYLTDTVKKEGILLVTSAFLDKEKPRFFAFKNMLEKRGVKIIKQARVDQALLQALYSKAGDSISEIEKRGDPTRPTQGALETYFNNMIEEALDSGISDIHWERRRDFALIRLRKHGRLYHQGDVDQAFMTNLAGVVYNVLAEEKDVVFNAKKFQQGAIELTTVSGRLVKLRYQSVPAYPDGFDVIMRVLPIGTGKERVVPLEKLGYSGTQVKAITSVISKPVGAFVIAGTTGSGKSTTLKNLMLLLDEKAKHLRKLISIEDPPEYIMPPVTQIPVDRKTAEKDINGNPVSPFAKPLMAAMRADPDVIMIGEVRDLVTGDGLKKATQSGHQVLTTVHAASALGIVERLADFGISLTVLGSPDFLSGLAYQRLVPLVCPHCSTLFRDSVEKQDASSEDIEIAERISKVVKNWQEYPIRKAGEGCEKCEFLNVVGRTVCSEIVVPDIAMLKMFKEGNSADAKNYWQSLSDNMPASDNMAGKTALEHAVYKMLKGLVTPHDVEETCGVIDLIAQTSQKSLSRSSEIGFSLSTEGALL